jgi:hypothetical protein
MSYVGEGGNGTLLSVDYNIIGTMDRSSADDGVYDDDDIQDDDEEDEYDEEEEEYEDEEEEDDSDDGPTQAFVAWLKPPTNSTTSACTMNDICVGEVHCVVSSSQHENEDNEDESLSALSSYCVVYELARLAYSPHSKFKDTVVAAVGRETDTKKDDAVDDVEDGMTISSGTQSERPSKKQKSEKKEDAAATATIVGNAAEYDDSSSTPAMLYYTFTNGFPFRVLPISICTAVQLQSIDAVSTSTTAALFANDDDDDDDEDGIQQQQQKEQLQHVFALDYNCAIELLNDDANNKVVEDVTTAIAAPSVDKVIQGVKAWWKAGEANSGWDISNIPNLDYTHNDASMLLGYHGLSSSLLSSSSSSATTTVKNNVNNDDNDDDNVLLQLYGITCANQLSLKTTKAAQASSIVVTSLEQSYNHRTELCSYIAWAIPNTSAIQTLLSLGPIIEIGAGTGYWAYILTKHGGDVIAYDMQDSHEGQSYRFRHSLVQNGGVEQIHQKCHSHRTLLLCWPDIVEESVADDSDRGCFSLDCLSHYNGTMLAYIGELGPHVVRTKKGWGDVFPPCGSSSSSAFQVKLNDSFDLVTRVCLPNWPPYNSHLTIWRRKK